MIVKYVSPEVFTAITTGAQTYIGKLNVGFWRDLKPGDRFHITDGGNQQLVEVKSLKFFSNFGDAWFILSDKLIPSQIANIITERDAISYFRTYYKESEDVSVYGVVAVEISLV